MPASSGGERRTWVVVSLSVMLVLASTTAALGQLSDDELATLRERGAAEGWTFTVGRTPATELPLDALCGAAEPPEWSKTAPRYPFRDKADLPDAFDWRFPPAGKPFGVTPVKNQLGCGACWAFATAGVLECAIRIQDGQTVDLSEQYLISCNTFGWGCDGGWFAHDFHMDRPGSGGGIGAVLESAFPYAASDVPCGGDYPRHYVIADWWEVDPPGDIGAIKQAIYEFGPVATGIAADGAFQAYSGGVFNACTSESVNHMVVLVGWDDSLGTNGCWILRNSWGTGWGESGYMYIEYGCSRVGQAVSFVDYQPSSDCNGNGTTDAADIVNGLSADCNENGAPDECDVVDGTSGDCNGNGVPDECDIALDLPAVVDDRPATLGWQEAASGGTALGLTDDGQATLIMPFVNAIFANAQITIHNNGGLGFGVSNFSLNASNNPLPSTAAFGGGQALLPLWDDLDSDTGDVYHRTVGSAPQRAYVVQWDQRPHYPGDTILDGDEVTFQVQIFETPTAGVFAQMLYRDVDFDSPTLDNGASATVGYQADADEAVQWSFNSAGVSGGDPYGTVLSVYADPPTSLDVNENGVPDECEAAPGDLNCDGSVDVFDINPFVTAVLDPAGYAAAHPTCDISNGDINGDGSVDVFDINPFVGLVLGG